MATACSTIDFSGVASVADAGCRTCTAGTTADCVTATCAIGYTAYNAATQTCTPDACTGLAAPAYGAFGTCDPSKRRRSVSPCKESVLAPSFS